MASLSISGLRYLFINMFSKTLLFQHLFLYNSPTQAAQTVCLQVASSLLLTPFEANLILRWQQSAQSTNAAPV